MWTTILVWAVAAVLLPAPRSVSATGVFELRIKSFINEFGKDNTGKCCSGSVSETGECSGVCKTRFRVCLKQYQVKIDTTTPCTYGDVVTPVLGDNIVNLQSNMALAGFTNPIRFPFDFAWPGTFSLIIEAYHDAENTTNESPEKVLITRLMTQYWLDVGPSWQQDKHQAVHSQMEYEYRVTCSTHYYGKGCMNLCRPRDDSFGHYSCSPTGKIVCLSGWTGAYCNTARCLSGCDPEHGHCSKPNECTCSPGWKGRFCDQCERYPGCLHGTCKKAWDCMCNEGWGGLFCNQDLNYCTNHKPCLHGGTCFNTGQGSYTCSCPPGFTGTDCETPFAGCHSKPCLNGGSCSDTRSITSNLTMHNHMSTYQCTCPPGWQGLHCEISSRSCRDSPCPHGATCVDDASKGYTCHCPAGFTGADCRTQIDECAPNPCQNGGSCTDKLNGYRCTCPTGFTGERCEINVDDCHGNPCLNGGTCLDMVNQFRCQCVPGFVGRVCQDKVDYCLAKPCANGGNCIAGTNDYRCVCKPGFTGKDCSIFVDECKSAPCQNGGICRNRVNGFSCDCPDGWSGLTCNQVGTGVAVRSPTLPKSNVPPSGASYWSGNLARPSAEARDAGLTTEHVVVIATLSTAVPAFVLVAALAVMCMKRRQKREQARADEEARLQNERNAVHSSLSKRGSSGGHPAGVSMVGGHQGLLGGSGGNAGAGAPGVCSLGSGDSHMIKNTWTASKNVNNASVDLDSSFQTDSGLDISCGGYKPEPVMQDTRSRTPKQLNTEAAAYRASHHFGQKDGKDCLVNVHDGGKRTSMFSNSVQSDSCCAAEAALLKRPLAADSGGGGVSEPGCGVYVIDDHYRHDATLAATLATEV